MSALSTQNLPTETHFRDLSRAMSLVLLEECFDAATMQDAPFSRKLDLLKLTTKLGDLEPKQVVATQGSGFQLIINLGDDDSKVITLNAGAPQTDMLHEAPTFISVTPTTINLAALHKAGLDTEDIIDGEFSFATEI